MSRSRLIGAIAGSDGEAIQALMLGFARSLAPGARVIGVVEVGDDLLDLASGVRYRLFEPLGAGADACSLDPAGPAQACGTLLPLIEQGCDLVVLNKFGKLEAESNSGLTDAFAMAVSQNIPVLTAISSRFAAHWQAFAGPLAETLAPQREAIEAWWGNLDNAPGQY